MIQNILKEKIIGRERYETLFKGYFRKPVIKVITGMRRVGKSSLLKKFIQNCIAEKIVAKKNIFYLSTELSEYDGITDYKKLNSLFISWKKDISENEVFCVCIDEIQEIKGWEKFVNSLLAEYQEKAQIYITGSNASLLSGDLATLLSGRYIQIKIFPLSYQEYSLFAQEKKSKKLFLEYLEYGGLPGIFSFRENSSFLFSYLQEIYSTVVLKDIIQYFSVRNPYFLEQLYKYILHNTGNIFSAKKIADYLKSQKIKTSVETVINYLGYATDAFLLYEVKAQDPNTKKNFEIYQKYYSGDIGLRNSKTGFILLRDIGLVLENYMYLTLISSGYTVQIGRLQNGKEVDFIAEKNGKRLYIQVCYLLSDKKVIEREFSVLENIPSDGEKYVFSLDDINFGEQNGIIHKNIMDIEKIIGKIL